MVGDIPDTILPGAPSAIGHRRFGNAEPKVTFLCSLSSGGNARQVWRVWDTGERCGGGRVILIGFLFLFFFFFSQCRKKRKVIRKKFLLFFYFYFFIFFGVFGGFRGKNKKIKNRKTIRIQISYCFSFFPMPKKIKKRKTIRISRPSVHRSPVSQTLQT